MVFFIARLGPFLLQANVAFFDGTQIDKQFFNIYRRYSVIVEWKEGRLGNILTFNFRPRPVELPQGNKLPPNFTILINQDGRRIPLRVPFNAHIGPYLAELDVPEFRSQLSPHLRQDARLHIPRLG